MKVITAVRATVGVAVLTGDGERGQRVRQTLSDERPADAAAERPRP